MNGNSVAQSLGEASPAVNVGLRDHDATPGEWQWWPGAVEPGVGFL